MKRRELLQLIADGARDAGVAWVLVRQGGYHEVWMLGGRLVAIPRHREIGERPARAMLKALEEELGDGWWER